MYSQATETLFRMGVARGAITTLRNGEVRWESWYSYYLLMNGLRFCSIYHDNIVMLCVTGQYLMDVTLTVFGVHLHWHLCLLEPELRLEMSHWVISSLVPNFFYFKRKWQRFSSNLHIDISVKRVPWCLCFLLFPRMKLKVFNLFFTGREKVGREKPVCFILLS